MFNYLLFLDSTIFFISILNEARAYQINLYFFPLKLNSSLKLFMDWYIDPIHNSTLEAFIYVTIEKMNYMISHSVFAYLIHISASSFRKEATIKKQSMFS